MLLDKTLKRFMFMISKPHKRSRTSWKRPRKDLPKTSAAMCPALRPAWVQPKCA